MTSLHLGTTTTGEPFTLPLDALTTMTAIIGRRGSGKTTTALDLAEEFISAGLPVVLFDPLGVHWGLRSDADGERPGLSVTILGGAHGDLPLEETAGKLIAELVVEQPGAYIIDFSGFESRAAEKRFAADFAERLYRLKAKHPSALGLIVDEADTFAPQNAKGEERMLGAFEAIARRGRVRGLGMVAITQRPAVLNKNVLSQCEVMIAHQLTAPQDREALKAWAQGNATPEQVTTFIDSLAGLQVGEAWVWSPAWLQVFDRVMIRSRRTFDSSATPKAGETRIEPKVLAPVDLEALRSRMAETVAKVEADDPKKLKAEIARLTKALANVDKGPAACDHEPLIAQLHADLRAAEDGRSTLGLRLEQIQTTLLNTLHDIAAVAEIAEPWIVPGKPVIERTPDASTGTRSDGDDPTPQGARGRSGSSGSGVPGQRPGGIGGDDTRLAGNADRAVSPSAGSSRMGASEGRTGGVGGVGLTAPRQKILDAIAAFEPNGLTSIAKSVIAAYAGVSPTSGGYFNNLGALRTLGLIEYPSGGYVSLTDAGRAQAQPSESIRNVRELHERWLKLLPAPRAKIVQALIEIFPNDIDKDELAERIGVSATSGGYFNNLGGLRTLGLVEYPAPKRVVATALLFPEGIPA